MKKELKEKWIAALESREYKQTTGALAFHDGPVNEAPSFCCLGVLCVVAGYKPDFTDLNNGAFTIEPLPYLGEGDEPEDFGYRGDGTLKPGDFGLSRYEIEAAINWNDDCGYSFTEIATLIRMNVQED